MQGILGQVRKGLISYSLLKRFYKDLLFARNYVKIYTLS